MQKPKEFGVYVKTSKKLVRIMPNIVFDQESMLYIERPTTLPISPLKDIRYFIIYGKYNMQVELDRANALLFADQSPLGMARFIFGKEADVDVKKVGEDFCPRPRPKRPLRARLLRHMDRRFRVGLYRGVTVARLLPFRRPEPAFIPVGNQAMTAAPKEVSMSSIFCV